MQKRITQKKVNLVLRSTCLSLFVLCISFNASLAQKQPAANAKTRSDQQRKQAEAAANNGTSAAFSDAVKDQSPAVVPTAPSAAKTAVKKNAAEKPTADIRKDQEAAKAAGPPKAKTN